MRRQSINLFTNCSPSSSPHCLNIICDRLIERHTHCLHCRHASSSTRRVRETIANRLLCFASYLSSPPNLRFNLKFVHTDLLCIILVSFCSGVSVSIVPNNLIRHWANFQRHRAFAVTELLVNKILFRSSEKIIILSKDSFQKICSLSLASLRFINRI